MENNQEIEWKLYCELFSERHMSKYMEDRENPLESAIQTYKANLKAISAFWPVLAVIEVALRTTLNAQLEKRNLSYGGKTNWTLDNTNEIRMRN